MLLSSDDDLLFEERISILSSSVCDTLGTIVIDGFDRKCRPILEAVVRFVSVDGLLPFVTAMEFVLMAEVVMVEVLRVADC